MRGSEVKPHVLVNRASENALDYDDAVGRLGWIGLLGLAACASSVPRTIPRVVDGRVEQGLAVSPYAYEWFIEGELQAAKGRHEEAAMALESATAAPAGDEFLLTRLAEEYEQSGENRRADRMLSLARRHYPRSARVALTEGRIEQGRGDSEAALDAFLEASERAPNWSAPVIAIAELLEGKGLTERATSLLEDFLETAHAELGSPARIALDALARRTGDTHALSHALSFDPWATAEDRAREAAELALQQARPALAARTLEETHQAPTNLPLWLRALRESGDATRAATFLMSPSAARAASVEERADMLVDLGEPTSALRLLAAAERSPRVQITRGNAFLTSGDYVRAANTLAEVPYGASTFEQSRLALADCASLLGRAGAGAEALSRTPYASLDVRKKLAEIYLAEGELRAALRLFDARRSTERAVLASLFEQAGRFEEAAAYYASVAVSSSNDSRVRARASAENLAMRGNRRSAIAILEQWANAAPTDFYARARLAELLRAERRSDEANSIARETLALTVDPRLRAHLQDFVDAAAQAPP